MRREFSFTNSRALAGAVVSFRAFLIPRAFRFPRFIARVLLLSGRRCPTRHRNGARNPLTGPAANDSSHDRCERAKNEAKTRLAPLQNTRMSGHCPSILLRSKSARRKACPMPPGIGRQPARPRMHPQRSDIRGNRRPRPRRELSGPAAIPAKIHPPEKKTHPKKQAPQHTRGTAAGPGGAPFKDVAPSRGTQPATRPACVLHAAGEEDNTPSYRISLSHLFALGHGVHDSPQIGRAHV